MDFQRRAACVDTIYVAAVATKASTGQPATYAAPVARVARAKRVHKRVPVGDGEYKTISWDIEVPDEITMSDVVWPPGADQTKIAEGSRPNSATPVRDYGTTAVSHWHVLL